jgi:hypothetical protein
LAKSAFISYQRADVARAHELASLLRRYGSEVWWDSGIEPGEVWREKIVGAMNSAEVFVVLHTAAAERSGEVLKELAVASSLKKPMIALRLENRQPSGSFLYEMAALNWVNAFTDTERELDDFARRLSQIHPTATPAAIAKAVQATKVRAPLLPRLIGNNLILLILLGAVIAAGFGFYESAFQAFSQQMVAGEGLLRPIAYTVGALLLGAPIFILTFVTDPPTTPAGFGLLATTTITCLLYLLFARNFIRWIGRSLAKASAYKRS